MNTVRKLSFGCALAALAYASVAAAQTEIAADIDAGRSQGTTVSTSGSVTTIDGGTRVGPNLFHSFRSFSLAAGDTARWTTMDALAIRAVINRITGGDVSFINGEIDAMGIPNADFFFINPAGIVFGSQAVVNVPAAAYFSTAGYLQFEDGVRYMAVTPAGSSLTMAAPSAFGFVGQQGDISVTGLRGSDLGAGVSSLTLAGANVTVADSDITVGEIGLFAVGTGESALIPLSGIMPSTRLGGRLFLDDSSIIVRATSSQVRDVRLAAGEIEQLGGSLLTDTAGGYRAGNLWIDADTITVRGAMGSETENDRRAGNIFLTGGDLSILQGGSLASETRLSGDAGNIRANLTGDILLAQGGQIATTTSGTGDAGNVILTSGGALTVTDGSVISASTSGAGAGGNVRIDVAGAMSVTDRSHVSSSSLASDSGQAGEVRITAGSLEVSDRSDILSTTVSSQSAGLVDIDVAGRVSVADFSTIASRTDGEGDAGAVMLSAGSLDIRRGSQVTSNTAGGGDAGAVWVDVDGALVIGSGGKITARAERGVTDGSAGDIFITAGSLVMEDREANTTFQGAEIASTLEGAGQGGSITIDIADHAYIGQGTFISLASTFRAIDGDAGDLFMRAGSMTINGGSIRSITRSFGNAGTLLIDVAGDLHLTGGGEITTSSLETYSGEAGRIGITAGNIYMDSASTITSSTASGQNAGEVVIVSAGDIFLDGDDTKISSSTTAGGNAGMVSVTSGGDLRMSKGALITASTSSTGSAGVIEMAIGGDLEMGFRANIETTTTGDGDAGAVHVAVAGDASIHDTSRIKSTTTGEGDAGEVRFSARSLDIRDASEITSNTQGGGNAGSVYVDIEDALVIGSGGKITARAARGATDGSAGDIFITAGSLIMEDHDPNSIRQGAEIASTLEGGGQGGSITIDVANHAYIGQGTFISLASTFRAIDGDGGDLFMRAGSMTINGGSIRSITRSLGNAGTLLFDIAGDLILTGGGEITTSSLETYSGEAGRIGISAGNLYMDSGSTITSSTASGQSAGQIFIETAGDVMLTGAGTAIATTTTGIGRAGDVYVESLGGMVGLSQGAQITAATSAAGDAGSVTVLAPLIDLTGGSSITSSALEGSTGQSGVLFVGADTIRVLDRSSIATISYNENSAGEVFVGADTLIVNGPGSRITSENLSADGGAAGLVSLAARDITISNGGQVTTNSLAGPAGDILIDMPRDGVLRLLGDAFPGEITTSSGANTGGVITIATPFLILSDGGSILALGEQGGANVRIDTQVFINSADNLNLLSVDGQLDVNSGIEDVASGVLLQDLSFLDASKVLRQACSNNRDSGEVSELKIQSPGPQADTRQDPITQGPNTEQLACR